MATLRDFYDVYGALRNPIANETVHARIMAFYDAVSEEQCQNPRDNRIEFASLPHSTVLGKKAEAALEALKTSVKS